MSHFGHCMHMDALTYVNGTLMRLDRFTNENLIWLLQFVLKIVYMSFAALHYFCFTIQLVMLRVFKVKVKNLAFDTFITQIITNASFFLWRTIIFNCSRANILEVAFFMVNNLYLVYTKLPLIYKIMEIVIHIRTIEISRDL
mgnify:CR=1 FL=1